MIRRWLQTALLSMGLAVSAGVASSQMKDAAALDVSRVTYHTTQVDGLKIFYREAGPKDAPTIVLLHGFPSSSHMFRELIPRLSDKYHVRSEERRVGKECRSRSSTCRTIKVSSKRVITGDDC